MLTAQGRFIHMKASAAEWAISLAVGLLLYGVLAVTLWAYRVDLGLAHKQQTTATAEVRHRAD